MHKQLEHVSNYVRVTPPIYTLHEVTDINGTQYRRFNGCVASGAIELPIVSAGRFVKDEYDAKEDVAALLLQKLCIATGRKIIDYNCYYVDKLESDLQKSYDENNELEMQQG
ncbi:hypothetical protein E2542_SST12326 [Spatholobus suberectus]|nr:hypothetical protein E2542_SST12326 [Spatholobus suberectus]